MHCGAGASGAERRAPTFERDVQPILTRAGCNAGACHGKARGQNGFQLSLLGFDPSFDYNAIVHEARGRRVFPAVPDQSLILLKATALVPHGGGRKLEPGSPFHQAILRWVADGMPRTPTDAPHVVGVSVEPPERQLAAGQRQPLSVTAHYSDGSTADVTHLAGFQSNESALVSVDAVGVATAGPIPGEAVISARFEGRFANCEVTIPLPGDVSPEVFENLPRRNFIDGLVWAKLAKLSITPSEPADDATFLRRAYLDVIGRLPSPDEARAFLGSGDLDRCARLVDQLLERPEYADHWANKWTDLLRPNPFRVGVKAVFGLDAWIRDAFRRNLPYDQFVRAIVTARGARSATDPPRFTAIGAIPRSWRRWSVSFSWASGSNAPGATITRSSRGARTSSTSSPRSSVGWAARGPSSRRRSRRARRSSSTANRARSSSRRPARSSPRARSSAPSRPRMAPRLTMAMATPARALAPG